MGTGTPRATPAGTVPAELTAACAEVAVAGNADVVAGARPRFAAAPASTAEAAALLSAAASLGLTVVPRGSGSRLHWANPAARCDLVVDTRRLDRVLEHAAGDLVVRVQAGVALDDLAAVLARGGQRLALDPVGCGANGTGTVGGVLATNSAGPLRYRFGAPRDLLIGITVVRPDGVVARSGGKVVKNVAGYDLGKLFAGSYGTLGLITEATFRLHPLPEESSWLSLDLPDSESAAGAVHAICDSPLWPSAVELDWPSADAPLAVSVLLEGDADSVETRVARMQDVAGHGTAEPFHVARPPSDGRGRVEANGTCVRVAFWVGQLGRVLSTIRTAGVANGVDPAIRGSAGAGVLEVALGAGSDAADVARFVVELRAGLAALAAGGVLPSVASAIVVWAPPEVRDAVELWGPVPSLGLMRSIKDQFDPERRMAPGRFAGGI
jgi:glycolate oxidase FAD binding subunit